MTGKDVYLQGFSINTFDMFFLADDQKALAFIFLNFTKKFIHRCLVFLIILIEVVMAEV